LQPFIPLVANPHLQTLLAHFWPTGLDERRFPTERKLYRTAPEVEVLVESQKPPHRPEGEIVLVHGLEGSSQAGYMKTMARAALEAGFAAHRLNLRSCGGTEAWSKTAYHSGLTDDLREVLRQLAGEGRGPLFAAGFSLGGNVVLKLAGELGAEASNLAAGVCAVSTPIDLAACVGRLEALENRAYERRFLSRLKRRIRVQHRLRPESFPIAGLESVRGLREFDDRFTARYFGFRNAAEYYRTQSACRVLDAIRVPALLLQAKDDPVIPFGIFERPEVRGNPNIELAATEHGGHLGFLARRAPRFWAEQTVMEWIRGLVSSRAGDPL
jgi:predicted alpha/beta-fold hydrolase